LLFVPLVGAVLAVLQLLIDRSDIAGISGVEITSGLVDETFDWLEVLEMDCVGESPALPIVE
jgi:hypothetical protein